MAVYVWVGVETQKKGAAYLDDTAALATIRCERDEPMRSRGTLSGAEAPATSENAGDGAEASAGSSSTGLAITPPDP